MRSAMSLARASSSRQATGSPPARYSAASSPKDQPRGGTQVARATRQPDSAPGGSLTGGGSPERNAQPATSSSQRRAASGPCRSLQRARNVRVPARRSAAGRVAASGQKGSRGGSTRRRGTLNAGGRSRQRADRRPDRPRVRPAESGELLAQGLGGATVGEVADPHLEPGVVALDVHRIP